MKQLARVRPKGEDGSELLLEHHSCQEWPPLPSPDINLSARTLHQLSSARETDLSAARAQILFLIF